MRFGKSPAEGVFVGSSAWEYGVWFQSSSGRYAAQLENRLLLELVPPELAGPVLDVGCGTGTHLFFLSRLGGCGVGIDSSADMLRIAQRRVTSSGTTDIFLVRARAEALPFQDHSFNLVFLVTSLEFFNEPVQALKEAWRVGRGCLLVAVLNRLSLCCLWLRVKMAFQKSLFQSATFYDPWELKRRVQKTGPPKAQVKITWRTTLFSFPVVPLLAQPLLRRIDRLLTYLHWPFGAFLVMWAEVN